MKTLVILCNIVMFCFTCMVLVTDGMAKEAAYIVFALLLLLVPLLTVFVFAGGGGASSRALQRAALIGNVVLLAASAGRSWTSTLTLRKKVSSRTWS